jgi:hypothetical protein
VVGQNPGNPPAPGAPARSPGRVCPSCGWPNPPKAERCGFCTAALATPPPAPPVERRALCPHCGEESVGVDPFGRCPVCHWGYLEHPTPMRKILAFMVSRVHGRRLSPLVIVVGSLLAITLINVAIQLSGQGKAQTADHIRQLKQRLEIYEGENGGYPPTLEGLERRYGPIPPAFAQDGWDRPIQYKATGGTFENQDAGTTLYTRCELRSAGRNGRFGDADDMTWNGVATGR